MEEFIENEWTPLERRKISWLEKPSLWVNPSFWDEIVYVNFKTHKIISELEFLKLSKGVKI